MALDAGRLAGFQGVERDFFQGDGAGVLLDEGDLAAEAAEPFRDRLGVGDAPAEEEELGIGRSDSQDGLIGRPAAAVGQHLVFVHHQQVREPSLE